MDTAVKLSEPIALFDLDGTLADYDSAMRRDMRLLQAPGEPEWSAHADDEPGWLEWRPRGLVIMPAHAWNEGFSHPNVVRYLGRQSLSAVRERLTAVRATCAE